ncbi:hypothetical protein ED208_02165 [Stagnimonas aquatica]|uniref:Tetratricopeptide repeat protein n=1 Tax=Stagnimonas aquatica TaxID=2689987 RepID=A0A3N0VKQ1_9GAMM|nr:hypothetical protein [Stagnimonas aquatica]ROH93349.1 hypothetical protein ED208_02165 [Stagnimonas aquatica]
MPSSLAPAPPSPSPSTGLGAEAERRLAELEQRQESVVNSVIEARSKTIDWWLAYLAVFTAVIGLVGLLIPFIIGRKERERLQVDLDEVRRMKGEIDSHLQGSRKNLDESNALLAAQRPESKDSTSSPKSAAAVDKAVAEVKAAEAASPTDRLRAEALASKAEPEKAYALWHALLSLSPGDAQAAFYCGYWAQSISEQDGRADASWWRQRGIAHYQRAVELDGRSHWALNNWGNALTAEARALAQAGDLPTARSLWQQAGQRYADALRIKPDKHEAAYNWGSALDDEALALAQVKDLPTARSLWQQAGQRYADALRIKPDKHEAAYNWGNALAAEALALAQVKDLPTARSLWQQAGQRYADALRIKPDMHEVASNWASTLLHEAEAIGDSAEARGLCERARDLMLPFAERKPSVAAYNLACAYARLQDFEASLTWLRRSRDAGGLPDREHLETDPDLAELRLTPGFKAFLGETFGG